MEPPDCKGGRGVSVSQGGANLIPAWFYEWALQSLPDFKSICNLGSGEVFSLETLAHERGATSITAYDITQQNMSRLT